MNKWAYDLGFWLTKQAVEPPVASVAAPPPPPPPPLPPPPSPSRRPLTVRGEPIPGPSEMSAFSLNPGELTSAPSPYETPIKGWGYGLTDQLVGRIKEYADGFKLRTPYKLPEKVPPSTPNSVVEALAPKTAPVGTELSEQDLKSLWERLYTGGLRAEPKRLAMQLLGTVAPSTNEAETPHGRVVQRLLSAHAHPQLLFSSTASRTWPKDNEPIQYFHTAGSNASAYAQGEPGSHKEKPVAGWLQRGGRSLHHIGLGIPGERDLQLSELLNTSSPRLGPGASIPHELEHTRQPAGLLGGVYEPAAVIAELAALGKAVQESKGREAAYGIPVNTPVSMGSLGSIAAAADQRGYFRGKTITELLATPEGRTWLKQKATLPETAHAKSLEPGVQAGAITELDPTIAQRVQAFMAAAR